MRGVGEFHTIMRPLFQALAGKNKPNVIEWSADKDLAFERTKEALAKATLLTHPTGNAPTALRDVSTTYM